jgi:pimeloyl-ACP methyl ester carboxylesterase
MKRWSVLGAAVGAVAALLCQSRRRRLALAHRIDEITERAVESLGVPAESRFLTISDLRLHGVLEFMAAALAQPSAMRAMIHWYRAAFRYRPVRRAQAIAAPTRLLWAEDDVALGKPLTYGLARWVPDLEIHYIPRCGHWVQNEAPGEVNRRLLAFLQPAKKEPPMQILALGRAIFQRRVTARSNGLQECSRCIGHLEHLAC